MDGLEFSVDLVFMCTMWRKVSFAVVLALDDAALTAVSVALRSMVFALSICNRPRGVCPPTKRVAAACAQRLYFIQSIHKFSLILIVFCRQSTLFHLVLLALCDDGFDGNKTDGMSTKTRGAEGRGFDMESAPPSRLLWMIVDVT